jgi:hypothetical protein
MAYESRLLRDFFSMMAVLSSRTVTQIQNQVIISTNMKVKKRRFLRPSPPQPAGRYAGLWELGWLKWPRE